MNRKQIVIFGDTMFSAEMMRILVASGGGQTNSIHIRLKLH